MGKEFSAKAILDQVNTVQTNLQEKESHQTNNNLIDSNPTSKSGKEIGKYDIIKSQEKNLSNVIDILFKQEQNNNYTPHELLKKRRKKKSKKLNW